MMGFGRFHHIQPRARVPRHDETHLAHRELLAWLGDRPLADVLATLRTPVVQSAVEETLANWLRYGTGR